MKAIQDKVIVQKISENEVTPAGIIMPTTDKKATAKGRVVEVGEGYIIGDTVQKLSVAIGDVVIFPLFAGVDISCNGHQVCVIVEKDILAIE